MDNYNQLIERIAQSSGMPVEDIERKIEAKRAKLSGLISKEGAAQIVAAELGIVFDNERMKISELVEGMKRTRIIGKITKIFPVRSYSKNGRDGKIGSLLIGDESSNVRVVLWDMHHISLIENNKLSEGDTVDILNGSVRNGEVHLGAFSDIKPSSEIINDVKTERKSSFGTIKEAQQGKYMKIRGFLMQLFDPKYFDDKSTGEKRALFNIVLDDGSETIRGVLGMEQARQIGFSDEEIFSLEKFNGKKGDVLGEEKVFIGSFRNNTYFNKLEFSIDKVEDVDVEALIKELENYSLVK